MAPFLAGSDTREAPGQLSSATKEREKKKMRNFRKFGTLAAAVLALSAIGAASASAAQFTASATGSISSKASEAYVFTTNGGTISCNNGVTSGTIATTSSGSFKVNVSPNSCTAFGFATAEISTASYEFTAGTGKNVHVKNTITITPTFFGASMCSVTVKPQTVGTVDFSNASGSTVKVNPTVTGITYTSSGGSCGSSGENGTYTGASIVERFGGGSVQYDA